MRKYTVLMVMAILAAVGLISGCRSGKDRKAPSGKFMQNESSGSSKSYFAREQERRRQYEREFKDVRRPMNQDHFQVSPWRGKHYTPRSERLHESSREPDSSIYKF